MASYREEEDPFEEDIVFDQTGLLNSGSKMNTAIRRVSSGKCVLFAKTLGLCGAFFGLGLCIAIPGPTFPSPFHPSLESESSFSPISNVYIARTSGYVIGSIIGGYLFDRFNRLFLLFLSLLLTAIFIIVTPWCQALWILETCVIILGITMGFLDAGGNVLCLDLWGRNSGPFMQALHFSFGLGAFVAPLLAAPFLEAPLANVSLSTEFSHVITEFPVHLEDSKNIAFNEGRLRRDVEPMKDFPDFDSEEISRNLSSSSLFVNNSENATDVTTGPTTFNPSSSFSSDVNSETFLFSTKSTSMRPRVPKRKPIKTDASKLGTKNWDKVHVGIPPPSDLLPVTTSPPPSPSVPLKSFSLITTESVFSASVSPDVYIYSSTLSLTSENVPSSVSTSETTEVQAQPIISTIKSLNVSSETTPKAFTPSSMAPSLPPPKALSSVLTLNNMEKEELSLSSETSSSSMHTSESPLKTDTPKMSISTDVIEMDEVKGQSDDSFRKQIPVVPVLPSHETYSRSDVDSNLKSSLANSKLLKLDSQNFSSNTKLSNTGLLSHALSDAPSIRLPVEKAVDISGLSTDDTLFTSSQKTNDENALSQKNAFIPTLNSATSMSYEQNDKAVSFSPIPPGNPLSTSLPVIGHSHHVHHKPGTFDNDTEHINTIFDIFANRVEKYGFNKIQFTYLIVGIFVFLISLVFLGFLCHNPRDPKSKQEGMGGKKITNKIIHRLLVALMAFFFFLYMGLGITYGQLIIAFSANSNLQLSVVFWGSFAAMRFASIFFASGFSPLTMLLLNFAFCTFGTILTSFANSFDTALWVGTALVGIGLASMFPTGILWIERYIHVSNKVAAIFVIGVALGELICPVTIYELMVVERMLFMYAALVINVICILTFVLLWWLASHQGEKYTVINSNGYQLANQHDEEEDMMDMSPSGSGVLQRRNCFSSEHRSLLNGNIHRGP